MHWFSPDPPVPRLLRSLYSPRFTPLSLLPRFPLQGLDVLLFLRGWVPSRFRRLSRCGANMGATRGTVRGRFKPAHVPVHRFPPPGCGYRPQRWCCWSRRFAQGYSGYHGAAGGFSAVAGQQGPNAAWSVRRRGFRESVLKATVQFCRFSCFVKPLWGISQHLKNMSTLTNLGRRLN